MKELQRFLNLLQNVNKFFQVTELYEKFGIEQLNVKEQCMALAMINAHNDSVNSRLENLICSKCNGNEILKKPSTSDDSFFTSLTSISQNNVKHNFTLVLPQSLIDGYVSLINADNIEDVISLIDEETDSKAIYQGLLLELHRQLKEYFVLRKEEATEEFENEIYDLLYVIDTIKGHLQENKSIITDSNKKPTIYLNRTIRGNITIKSDIEKQISAEYYEDVLYLLNAIRNGVFPYYKQLHGILNSASQVRRRNIRIIFTLYNNQIILLHVFVKKEYSTKKIAKYGEIVNTVLSLKDVVKNDTYYDSLDLSQDQSDLDALISQMEDAKRMVF